MAGQQHNKMKLRVDFRVARQRLHLAQTITLMTTARFKMPVIRPSRLISTSKVWVMTGTSSHWPQVEFELLLTTLSSTDRQTTVRLPVIGQLKKFAKWRPLQHHPQQINSISSTSSKMLRKQLMPATQIEIQQSSSWRLLGVQRRPHKSSRTPSAIISRWWLSRPRAASPPVKWTATRPHPSPANRSMSRLVAGSRRPTPASTRQSCVNSSTKARTARLVLSVITPTVNLSWSRETSTSVHPWWPPGLPMTRCSRRTLRLLGIMSRSTDLSSKI